MSVTVKNMVNSTLFNAFVFSKKKKIRLFASFFFSKNFDYFLKKTKLACFFRLYSWKISEIWMRRYHCQTSPARFWLKSSTIASIITNTQRKKRKKKKSEKNLFFFSKSLFCENTRRNRHCQLTIDCLCIFCAF